MDVKRKRVFVPIFMFVLTAGMIARSPRIAEIRMVDVLLIFACGMCLGSAIAGFFRARRETKDIVA